MTEEMPTRSGLTVVVNLYGGPGTGKSTAAAAVFAALKQKGINCELATEYAKDVVWEGRDYLLSDQIYLFAKQNRKLARLYGKVQVIVTDSPLLFCYYYSGNEHILALIQEEMLRAIQIHVMLRRIKPYIASGRYQTEEEARTIDKALRRMLDTLSMSYHEVDANAAAVEKIIELILPGLQKRGQSGGVIDCRR